MATKKKPTKKKAKPKQAKRVTARSSRPSAAAVADLRAQLKAATAAALESTGLGAALRGLLDDEPAGEPTPLGGLFQPDLDLALCIGPEPDTVLAMAESLLEDLEEMRWDGGRRAQDSKLLPELEALVEEAGDPYEVPLEALESLVRRHCAREGSREADASIAAIEAHGG